MSEGGGMADARDLKSLELKTREGSTPFPRTIFVSSCSGIPSWVSDFFTKPQKMKFTGFNTLKECNMDAQGSNKVSDDQACNSQLIRESERIYFPSSVQLKKDLAIAFDKDAKITLKQGTSKVVVDYQDLQQILHLSHSLLDHKAIREAEEAACIKREEERLSERLAELKERE